MDGLHILLGTQAVLAALLTFTWRNLIRVEERLAKIETKAVSLERELAALATSLHDLYKIVIAVPRQSHEGKARSYFVSGSGATNSD